MATPVPARFPFPSRAGIASGKPVRAQQLAPVAEALMYLRGHSRVLVPCTAIDHAIPASTTRIYTVPMQIATWMRHIAWHIRLRSTSAVATVAFTDPTGGTSTYTVAPLDADVGPRVSSRTHVETLSTPVTDSDYLATPRTITIQRTDAGGGSVYVDMLGATALSRESLESDADDLGISVPTVRPDTPIVSDDYISLGGIVRAMADQDDATLHGYTDRHLFFWTRPQGQGVSVTSAWAPIFIEGPVIQASHRYVGETLRRVYCGATGKVTTSGDTLEVRFTAASGDTVTETLTATTSGTWGLPVELDVYAEDLSTSDGRRSDTDEIVTIEARVTGAGTQTGSLEGLVIYESRIAT